MKKTAIAVMGLLFTIALFAACEPRQDVSAASRNQASDTDLENAVKSQLNSDPQVRDANLTVSADAKEIRLSGAVSSEAVRTRAIELARNARPGIPVADNIDIKPSEPARSEYSDEEASQERSRAQQLGEKIGNSIEDAWIHMKIVSKLIANTGTPEHRINVDVVDGAVTLRGSVDNDDQKSKAEQLAQQTEGVNTVHNELQVTPSPH